MYLSRTKFFIAGFLISFMGMTVPLQRVGAYTLTPEQEHQVAMLAFQLRTLRELLDTLKNAFFGKVSIAHAATVTTVTFDNPAPPGDPDSLLTGVFGGIDWSANQWRWTGPYASNTTNGVYFDSATGTSRTFTFSPAPKVLQRVTGYTKTAGTLTLTDDNNQTKTQDISTGSLQTVNTGWTLGSRVVTVNFTHGWELGVDDITYQDITASSTPTPTPTPSLPSSISSPLPVPVPVQTPAPPSSVTLTFDNPAPPGDPDSLLTGVFGGIDWSANQWRWTGPYTADPTNAVYFSSDVPSRSFRFSAGPRTLQSMQVYSAQKDGVLTLTDDKGQTKTQSVAIGSMQTVATGWTQPSDTVTVAFSAGWNLGIDDITSIGSAPPATNPSAPVTVPIAVPPSVPSATSSQPAKSAGELVAAYSFNESSGAVLHDVSGHENHGSITGATWAPAGRYGSALSFSGNYSYVTVSDSNSLDLATGMTLEAWVNPATFSGWTTVLEKETPSSLAYALYANSNLNNPSGHVNTGSDNMVLGSSQIPFNTWTHLATTYDGAIQRLYINGTEVASRPQTGVIAVSKSPLRIGGNGVWGEYFNGRIDEVRIYNYPRTRIQIQGDMNTPLADALPSSPSGSPAPSLSAAPIPTTAATSTAKGLVAAYGFNEGVGVIVGDRSDHGHAGNLTSASWTSSGKYGSALSFDGTKDIVTVQNSDGFDVSSGLTLEAWVKPSANLSGWRAIVAKEEPGALRLSYYLYANSDTAQPAAGITIGGTEYALRGGVPLPINIWTHLATTYDGAIQRLYINGSEVAQQRRTGSVKTTANPLRIGGDSIWGDYFQGTIDEVKIYNRALSQSEIITDMGTPTP